MSKKGTEMSINVLVGIILGMIMLSAAIFLFFKMMDNSNDTQAKLDDQTRLKMVEALDSGEPIYVPSSNIVASKNSAIVWIGIRNIESESLKFRIDVTALTPTDFDMSRVAYIGRDDANYNKVIAAKDNDFVNIAINTKGLNQKISLLVTVTQINSTNQKSQYWKPKIITIQP
jgi:hypothetical protein